MNIIRQKLDNYVDKSNRNPFSKVLPGLLICFLIIISGIFIADQTGVLLVFFDFLPEGSASPISGIFVAIIIGIVIRNTIGIHTIFIEGIAFSVKYALRAGIILLGLRLSLAEALKLGGWGIPL